MKTRQSQRIKQDNRNVENEMTKTRQLRRRRQEIVYKKTRNRDKDNNKSSRTRK